VNIQASTITSGRGATQSGHQGDDARHRRRTRRRIAPAALAGASILASAAVAVTIVANPFGHEPAKTPGHSPARSLSYRIVSALTDLHHRSVLSVAFSPGGKTLATGTSSLNGNGRFIGNGRVYLWDVATGRKTATLTDPGSHDVTSVVFSPGGKTLATSDVNSEDGKTYLWDLATRRLTATLTNPVSTGGQSMAFSHDGKTLAIDEYDGRIYLSDVARRRLTNTLTDPGSQGATSVAFSPDRKALATGDVNGKAYLWDID
jgi:WD40 repeat protein